MLCVRDFCERSDTTHTHAQPDTDRPAQRHCDLKSHRVAVAVVVNVPPDPLRKYTLTQHTHYQCKQTASVAVVERFGGLLDYNNTTHHRNNLQNRQPDHGNSQILVNTISVCHVGVGLRIGSSNLLNDMFEKWYFFLRKVITLH